MGLIYKIKCKNCGHTEDVFVNVEGKSDEYEYTLQNTFYCEDCGELSTIDILNEEQTCKKCKSKKITKKIAEYKCKKCGGTDFEKTEEAET